MKVLTLSTVFPNAAQPVHGLFVFERIRHAAQHAEVRVVAPVAWFRRARSIPRSDTLNNLPIDHPVFFYVPGVLKVLDGLFLFLSVLPLVRRIRRTFDFDLVDAHFGFPEGFAAVLLGWWFRRPVVITLRGSEHEFTGYRFRRLAIRWALRRATRVIAVSHPLAALARGLGVPSERIEVIENGVDTEIFRPSERGDARRLVGVDAGKRLLISVGHLVPLKGFHRMIGALPELDRKYPGVTLVLIGGSASTSGNYPQELRQLAARLGLSSQVLFTGALPPDQVRVWLNAADLFVLCSDREGCPNVVWEALACGLPIASPKVGEVEYMVPPVAGVLFDDPSDADALRDSIVLALDRKWNPAEIRRHAEAHTWAHVAERVLQQWQTCVRGTHTTVDALTPADRGLKPTG
jgi:teichuronic acid biosynthesis glycosyltransferase TuaC